MSDILKVTADYEKYTFLQYTSDWRVHIHLHGSPWLIIEEGHKALSSLMWKVIELQEEIEKLKALEHKEDK